MSIVREEGKIVHFTTHDEHAFLEAIQGKAVLFEAEQFDSDVYLDKVIEKSWGNEYRVYADNFYDLWKLSLLPGQSTSLHCHPRKETTLLCLAGTGKIQFLEETRIVRSMDFIHIEKGVFHSTENIGDDELELIEVEVPRNKLDLVRFLDKYGRKGEQYERKFLTLEDPIHYGRLVRGSKLRFMCINRRYCFTLRAGMDILCRPQDELLFVVSLSMQRAINHQIQVIAGRDLSNADLAEETLYMTISRNTHLNERLP